MSHSAGGRFTVPPQSPAPSHRALSSSSDCTGYPVLPTEESYFQQHFSPPFYPLPYRMGNENVSATSTFVSKASLNFAQIMGNDMKKRYPDVTLGPAQRSLIMLLTCLLPFQPVSGLPQKPTWYRSLSLPTAYGIRARGNTIKHRKPAFHEDDNSLRDPATAQREGLLSLPRARAKANPSWAAVHGVQASNRNKSL